MAQVISGIGLIGAGTIVLLKQTQIKGLTTAAAQPIEKKYWAIWSKDIFSTTAYTSGIAEMSRWAVFDKQVAGVHSSLNKIKTKTPFESVLIQ